VLCVPYSAFVMPFFDYCDVVWPCKAELLNNYIIIIPLAPEVYKKSVSLSPNANILGIFTCMR